MTSSVFLIALLCSLCSAQLMLNAYLLQTDQGFGEESFDAVHMSEGHEDGMFAVVTKFEEQVEI